MRTYQSLMFISIQKLLPSAYTKLGVKLEVEAALICEKYRKIAPGLIHERALDHTFPKHYKNKVLTVGAENSAWASQIAANQNELIRLINESLGQNAVTRILTRIADKK